MSTQKRKKPRSNTKRNHTTKRKKTKKQPVHLANIVLTILLITTTISIVSYFMFFNNWDKKGDLVKTAEERIAEQVDQYDELPDDMGKYFEEKTEAFDKIYLTQKPEPIEKPKEEKVNVVDENKKKDPLSVTKKDMDKKTSKPMLAIIIDDVTSKSQVKHIQALGYPVNISFLPPTPRHKNSANVAAPIEKYMVHLPMQATSFKFEEDDTLHVGDSYEKIDKRLALIKNLYPRVKYINNHTGSKFTADYDSMDRFMRAMKKHDLYFLDSRTTAKSKAVKTAQKHGVKFLVRNIFLDNEKDFDYIQGQLKKALKIAKRNGHAIAIGHPYKITLKVLNESKDLLKDFELVFIDRLPLL